MFVLKNIQCVSFLSPPQMKHYQMFTQGMICGVRIEKITHTLMQNIQYLDKLIDELFRSRKMSSMMRSSKKIKNILKI